MRNQLIMRFLCLFAFLLLYFIAAKDAEAQAAPRVRGTLTGEVIDAAGTVLDCVGMADRVSVGFSYDLDDIDESSSGDGLYVFYPGDLNNPPYPKNFLSISIVSSACNELMWTSGESFTIEIANDSLDSIDLFDAWGEQPMYEFPSPYEPKLMGFRLSDENGEMITIEEGPGAVPFFSIHPQYIDDGWGLMGVIAGEAGGEFWYIEFQIDLTTVQITEEPDNIPVTEEPDYINVPVDIKPRGCKNRLNVKKKGGTVSVGIMGSDNLDVNQIDPASVVLKGLSPLGWSYKDVNGPGTHVELGTDKAKCQLDCTNGSPDGYPDLILKFKRRELIEALGAAEDGDCLPLRLEGYMMEEFGGTPIKGEDVLSVVKKAKKKKEKKPKKEQKNKDKGKNKKNKKKK